MSSAQKTYKFGAFRSISALSLREMFSTYGRSPGGYIWAFLEPIGTIIILSVLFTLVVRTPPIGTSFILFFATGFLPFSLFTVLQSRSLNALRASRALLSYPRVVWLDAIIATFLLNSITKILVIITVWLGVLWFVNGNFYLHFWPILNGLLIIMLCALGIGILNSLLIGLFPIWASIWSIASRPLFLGSGILIMYDELPDSVQAILWWNPLLHAVSSVRSGFYPTYNPNWLSYPYAYGFGLMAIMFGLLFMRAWHQSILEN